MVNGTSLTTRLITGSGAGEGSRIMGAETAVNNELAEVGGLFKVMEGSFVRSPSLMDLRRECGNLPNDPFKTVGAWIISGCKRKFMESRGRGRVRV